MASLSPYSPDPDPEPPYVSPKLLQKYRVPIILGNGIKVARGDVTAYAGQKPGGRLGESRKFLLVT